MARRLLSLSFFPATALLLFCIPLYHFDRTLPSDWNYFNSLSWVVRSAVFHYRTFPLHDPWIYGGIDLLTNPQSRIFSPIGLLDLAMTPPHANLLSLIVYAGIGLWGTFLLMTRLAVSPWVARVMATLFVGSSWFGLHFTEGHIPFGSLQLLPLVLYCFLQIDRRRGLGMVLLLSWMILDGGIYAVIFSTLLMANGWFVDLEGCRQRWRSWFCQDRPFAFYIVLLFMLLVAIKVIPAMMALYSRLPHFDFVSMPFRLVLTALFDPFQTIDKGAGIVHKWRFHEFGCYLGVVGAGCILVYLVGGQGIRRDWKWAVSALFWFWIGNGWLKYLHPWWLTRLIPFLNIAHVQSRTWLIMYLFLLILLGRGLERFKQSHPRLCFGLLIYFFAEALFVHSYPFYRAYRESAIPFPEGLIRSTTISRTVERAQKPLHYLVGNQGSVVTYEPMKPISRVRASSDQAYRGEVYLLEGVGDVRLAAFTPGKIHFTFAADQPPLIEFNTHHLYGWKVVEGSGLVITDKKRALLRFQADSHQGAVTLQYWPDYLVPLAVMYLLGLIASWVTWRWIDRSAPARKTRQRFHYDMIPPGYYHEILERGRGVRAEWHRQKFARARLCLPKRKGQSIMDVGCFSGTFLSLLDPQTFSRQVGVDIAGRQIAFATQHFGTPYRKFVIIGDLVEIDRVNGPFDCMTVIEVIEHLEPAEIAVLLHQCSRKLRPGGTLLISTPNYLSTWPLLEFLINRFSDISYEEQHVTRFHYLNMVNKLQSIYPRLLSEFTVALKTTSHFISPFLAVLSTRLADRASRRFDPSRWRFPFGNLVLLVLTRKEDFSPRTHLINVTETKF